jgi:hypothetical protein
MKTQEFLRKYDTYETILTNLAEHFDVLAFVYFVVEVHRFFRLSLLLLPYVSLVVVGYRDRVRVVRYEGEPYGFLFLLKEVI